MSARARAYSLVRPAVERGLRGAGAAHRGLWLGLLDRRDLHEIDHRLYHERTAYRDAEYLRSGLFGWEEEAVAHFPPSGSLLVTAAGAGREVLALARRGYEVTGVECHPELLARGRALLVETGARAELRAVGRDEPPPPGGPYDGIVVGWSSYTLVAGRARRVAFLRGLRAQAAEGAPILVSFFSRRPDDAADRLVAGVAGALRRVRGAERVELGDDLAPNYIHRFTAAEIAAELRDGGFAPVWHREQEPGPRESGVVVARATLRSQDRPARSGSW